MPEKRQKQVNTIIKMTISSMKMFLRTELKYKKFNLVDSFNSFCCREKLKNYLYFENVKINDLKMTEVDNHLKLNKKLSFKIRQGVFNAFGTLIIDNVQEDDFEPSYKVYENESLFNIFISIPGRLKGTSDNISIKHIKEDNSKGISIEGKCGEVFKRVKEEDFLRKEGVIVGNFNKRIMFCDNDKDFNFEKRDIEYVEGIVIVRFPKNYCQHKPIDNI